MNIRDYLGDRDIAIVCQDNAQLGRLLQLIKAQKITLYQHNGNSIYREVDLDKYHKTGQDVLLLCEEGDHICVYARYLSKWQDYSDWVDYKIIDFKTEMRKSRLNDILS